MTRPEIGGDRLKTEEQIDAILVDLFLELIDLFVVRDGLQTGFVVARLRERFVEEDVLGRTHER